VKNHCEGRPKPAEMKKISTLWHLPRFAYRTQNHSSHHHPQRNLGRTKRAKRQGRSLASYRLSHRHPKHDKSASITQDIVLSMAFYAPGQYFQCALTVHLHGKRYLPQLPLILSRRECCVGACCNSCRWSFEFASSRSHAA